MAAWGDKGQQVSTAKGNPRHKGSLGGDEHITVYIILNTSRFHMEYIKTLKIMHFKYFLLLYVSNTIQLFVRLGLKARIPQILRNGFSERYKSELTSFCHCNSCWCRSDFFLDRRGCYLESVLAK